jgi:hypothetical protein
VFSVGIYVTLKINEFALTKGIIAPESGECGDLARLSFITGALSFKPATPAVGLRIFTILFGEGYCFTFTSAYPRGSGIGVTSMNTTRTVDCGIAGDHSLNSCSRKSLTGFPVRQNFEK